MTLEEKREFIESFCDSTKRKLLRIVEKSPEHWDGKELRHLVEAVVSQGAAADHYLSKRTGRYQKYKSDLYAIW